MSSTWESMPRVGHHVIPVQAKGGRDELNIVQIEQDMALCDSRFPELICRPVAAQFMHDDEIALFAFEKIDGEVNILTERHWTPACSRPFAAPPPKAACRASWP